MTRSTTTRARRRTAALGLALLLCGVASAGAQRVVDRIVARIEGDVVTLSELRELRSFQELVEGHSAAEAKLVDLLLEQWIVNAEASTTRFPRLAPAEVQQALERLEKQFPSPEAYRARCAALELSPEAVRRHLEQQLFLVRYLDWKFRPAVQVHAREIEQYYREELAPRLARSGQGVPPLAQVDEMIRELLTQRQINELAARWLEEMRARLRIVVEPGGHLR